MNYELKQKIAEVVTNYLFIKNGDDDKRQPYRISVEKSYVKAAILKSHMQIYGEQAHVDYEFQRFCVTTKNPQQVLMVYNLIHENISEK